jgi:hypothetical protein
MTFPAWQAAGNGAATPWAASSGTSKTILVPSGATAGHLGIIVVATNGGASNNHSISGWTRKHQTTLLSWGDTYVMISLHWKKLVSGDINANAAITLGAALRGGASIHTFANAEVDSDPFVDPKISESATLPSRLC